MTCEKKLPYSSKHTRVVLIRSAHGRIEPPKKSPQANGLRICWDGATQRQIGSWRSAAAGWPKSPPSPQLANPLFESIYSDRCAPPLTWEKTFCHVAGR